MNARDAVRVDPPTRFHCSATSPTEALAEVEAFLDGWIEARLQALEASRLDMETDADGPIADAEFEAMLADEHARLLRRCREVVDEMRAAVADRSSSRSAN